MRCCQSGCWIYIGQQTTEPLQHSQGTNGQQYSSNCFRKAPTYISFQQNELCKPRVKQGKHQQPQKIPPLTTMSTHTSMSTMLHYYFHVYYTTTILIQILCVLYFLVHHLTATTAHPLWYAAVIVDLQTPEQEALRHCLYPSHTHRPHMPCTHHKDLAQHPQHPRTHLALSCLLCR
jgi:hypothetical protein